MKKKASQTDYVLAWIRAYGSISTMEAFRYLGVTRLSARIYDLKEQGFIFTTEKKKSKDGKHYFAYKIFYDPTRSNHCKH